MEEMVGRWWHVALTRWTPPPNAAAAVQLADMQQAVGLMFRAAGGAPQVRVAEASLRATAGPRHWLHRLAGSGDRAALPSLEPDVLSLPPSVAVFTEPALNRDLYLWLALLSAHWTPGDAWMPGNLRATQRALAAFPGFRPRHETLCALHLAQRPASHTLKGRAAQAEAAVVSALRGHPPGAGHWLANEVAPVWLWTQCSTVADVLTPTEGDRPPPTNPQRRPGTQDAQRRRAQAAALDRDGNPMVLPFRAEALMSWSEMVRVNRSTDDEDDGHALPAANDMDVLSVAPDGQTLAARVRFDLDLPSRSADDTPLGDGQKFPEWDFRQRLLLPDHCEVQEMRARQGVAYVPTAELRKTARQVRRRMEVLRHAPQLVRGQEHGDDIDLDAWIRLQADGHGPHARRSATPAVYTRRVPGERSLATWLLADLSQSTDAYANNELRVIDVIRDALYVFGEALHAVGDPFAMWGFSSVRRQHVRLQQLKGMDEPWNEAARARVGAIRPGFYTRMGAAVRHATAGLAHSPQRRRLLMLLTDGKPNDMDQYEGRYGLEDTRQAIHEARVAGITPFCVTIDRAANDYLPLLFGRQGYALVHRPPDLAHRLTQAWTLLARQH
ncbi:MAG: VWA domain-containing protein [Polaromonas sp.]|nr:VWA domain-containing protein [Polaromonas sp.]